MTPSRWFFCSLLFALVFTVEVKVKAEGLHLVSPAEVVQQPDRCLDGDGACAVQTSAGEKFALKLGNSVAYLDENSAVVKVGASELRLIAGAVWIRNGKHESISVTSEFGSALGKSEFWVWRSADRFIVAATEDPVMLTPRGSSEALQIDPGLQNFAGKIAKDGRASTGLPLPISPQSHIARWARLFSGSKAQFEKDVTAFRGTWAEASVRAAELHEALFQRKIASIEDAKEKRRLEQQKIESRNRELRDLFRLKTLGAE